MNEVTVYRSDAMRFIDNCSSRYDIVFADPPHDLELLADIPDRVFDASILVKEGWLILEHGKRSAFNAHPHFRELRKYGSVHFSVFC
jgi:16S rRNA G966 N2-methylase RsmD